VYDSARSVLHGSIPFRVETTFSNLCITALIRRSISGRRHVCCLNTWRNVVVSKQWNALLLIAVHRPIESLCMVDLRPRDLDFLSGVKAALSVYSLYLAISFFFFFLFVIDFCMLIILYCICMQIYSMPLKSVV